MADFSDFRRQPVCVLGASGFIGARVVAALADSPAWRPVPVSRRPAGPGSIVADATDPAALRAVLDGAACVVNCVAGSNRTLVRATEALCEAARHAPPRRIVHLSSMAVYGAATGQVREDHAPRQPLSGYGLAKLNAEGVIRRYIDGGGDAVILRPTCVFGPGSPQWTTRLATLLRARRLGDLGAAGDGGCNLAYIDDLVVTIVNALDAPGATGRAFNVSCAEVPTWNQFLVRFGMALGSTPVRRVTPRMLKLETKLLAPLRRAAGKTFDHPATEAITPSLAALFAQDIRIDSGAAAAELAMPSTPVGWMISESVRWLDAGASAAPAPEPVAA
jgi:nucleoside-diphosphate-sugar epimerase